MDMEWIEGLTNTDVFHRARDDPFCEASQDTRYQKLSGVKIFTSHTTFPIRKIAPSKIPLRVFKDPELNRHAHAYAQQWSQGALE